jgi:hypothetical protein
MYQLTIWLELQLASNVIANADQSSNANFIEQ